MQSTGTAGGHLERVFAAARKDKFKRHYRDVLAIGALGLGSGLVAFVADGPIELLGAGFVGFFAAILMAMWVIGDPDMLSYRRGAQGERDTAALLAQLDGWQVAHDVERSRGNWDHVVVSPNQRVFMIETKALSRSSTVKADALVSGRLRFRGAAFRAAAKELSQLLGRGSRGPWVQPVVAIWGPFGPSKVEENGVIYVAAEQLLETLEARAG